MKPIKSILVGITGTIIFVVAIFSIASTATAQTIAAIQWEYLSVDYSQNQIIGTQFDVTAEVTRFETISTSMEPYTTNFASTITDGCTIKDATSLFLDTDVQKCVGKNFKGRDYFLQELGNDGWELINLDNQSTEYTYHLDLIFKRPKQ
jgi:hypothetical protein